MPGVEGDQRSEAGNDKQGDRQQQAGKKQQEKERVGKSVSDALQHLTAGTDHIRRQPQALGLPAGGLAAGDDHAFRAWDHVVQGLTE